MILVSAGIKGGVGKTTVATTIALMRQAMGNTVILVDADEQRSAFEFAEQRAALGNGHLACCKASGKTTALLVRDLADKYETVVIDVGGRDTTAQRSALLAADIALLPFSVGSFDAWTLPQVEALISEIREANENLDAVSFLSRAYARGRDNGEAAEMLRASTVLRFSDTPLTERRAFARSAGDGLAVTECKPRDEKAIAEVQNLYNAVFSAASNATDATAA